jgi:hypothetical protein
MKHAILPALGVLSLMVSAPAQAEVIKTSDNGFITRDVAVVEANATEAWLALTNPADWWSSQHTWSADAANLRLTPQAGGCFCEKIPEVDEPGRFTLEGSVEHMRVIQAYPESALRMVGALGPLQSEPVTGVLTIALSEFELPGEFGRKGTKIVWEYNVGGSMRYEVPVISKAVDGVMSLQLAQLADKLGKVDMPELAPAPNPEPAPDSGEAATQLDAGEGGDPPVIIEAEPILEEKEGQSIDDVFGDLSDPEEPGR